MHLVSKQQQQQKNNPYPVKSDCLKSFEEVVSIDKLYIEIIALDAL